MQESDAQNDPSDSLERPLPEGVLPELTANFERVSAGTGSGRVAAGEENSRGKLAVEPISAGERELGEESDGVSPLRTSLHAAFVSTLTSLLVVLVLLVSVRLIVPTLVEEVRYAWFRGQLRAQYETSDQALQQV